MYGSAPAPQSEATPFAPRSPYAVGKVAGYWFAANYREAYDMFVSNGILFNHESPRRGETFVTRKITRALGRIKCGLQDHLYLGNLDAKRDWGFAGDYVEAMWLMLQHDEPGDYVVATGETYSVRDFLTTAFESADMNWEEYVRIDERYFRPTEVDVLLGDPSRAKSALGWSPKVDFKSLVGMMMEHDLELAQRERTLVDAGHKISLDGIANG
ncbi:MAG: GDP-mannose 4,6-dehydratase, partial [Pseudomonadota bacterium]|nr:GDP-mannose 4,6-dehydratase [Pseudomonadota bacterium]